MIKSIKTTEKATIFSYLKVFVQFNGRVRMDQVIEMLNNDIVPIEVLKSIRESKGIVENLFIKIGMTRSDPFLVTTFGEYIGIMQKGRATQ
jgi:hypothetical protein